MAEKNENWLFETTNAQNDSLVLSKSMLRSKAFIKLTRAAVQLLIESRIRLKLEAYKPRKNSKDKQFFASNNGQIVLTYNNIHKQYGYSTRTISKAIDRLVSVGFWEIAELGCGVKRQSHKIALVNNWQNYGTDNFKAGKGKADEPVGSGFKKRKKLEKPLQSKAGIPLQSKVVKGEKMANTFTK